MLDITTRDQLTKFFERLAQRYGRPGEMYVFGGCALLLMGGRRNTRDLDVTVSSSTRDELRQAMSEVASELELDVEESVPAEFMPLPTDADSRHILIDSFGLLKVFVFDLYRIAIMKLDRAFETDIEDVRYLLNNEHIDLATLELHVADVASRYDEPLKLRRNLEEMKRGL